MPPLPEVGVMHPPPCPAITQRQKEDPKQDPRLDPNLNLHNGFLLIFRGLLGAANNCTNPFSLSSPFHAQKLPKITLSSYFFRIKKYCETEDPTLIVALIYLYRIIAKTDKTFINANTIHRLIMVSVVIATKFLDDFLQTNTFYARVGGISLSELNKLESEFLQILDFDLLVSEPEYRGYEKFVRLATHATDTDSPLLSLSPPPPPSSSSSSSPPSFAPSGVEKKKEASWFSPLISRSFVGFISLVAGPSA
eukprot:CAMPEP_0201524176 /NCGR_PEP_ID=MMETSP0161_2-20130828/21158_1 /ASSEMBLY_ACC=CAM_ASM_000251 /TAXON_ID=180227 /ORGANISM="Neoparamoeba aestuarina, Strain SoJaBio B1-5/56/2" /LENGTH=250 /DNA_ID=CAMNT_0047923467 /DNA_START=17 /DNA_END=769 /DNA_ORIENTATION=+